MHGFLASFTLSTLLLTQSASPPAYPTDYDAALRAARSQNRPLLVVIDCVAESDGRVEQLSTPGDKAQAELLAKYQVCRIDVKTEYGRRAAQAFGAKLYPFTAVIDRTGSVILYEKSGRFTSDAWTSTLVAHQHGVAPQQAPVIFSSEQRVEPIFQPAAQPIICST